MMFFSRRAQPIPLFAEAEAFQEGRRPGGLHDGSLLGPLLFADILHPLSLQPCILLAPELGPVIGLAIFIAILSGPDLCPRMFHAPDGAVVWHGFNLCPGILRGTGILYGIGFCLGHLRGSLHSFLHRRLLRLRRCRLYGCRLRWLGLRPCIVAGGPSLESTQQVFGSGLTGAGLTLVGRLDWGSHVAVGRRLTRFGLAWRRLTCRRRRSLGACLNSGA